MDRPEDLGHGSITAVVREISLLVASLSVKTALDSLEHGRYRQTQPREAALQELDAQEVHLLEGPNVPGVAPFHCAVDADQIVRDDRRGRQDVVREAQQILARKLTVASLELANPREPLRQAAGSLGAASSPFSGFCLWTIVEGLPIEGLDRLADAPVKARAGLLTRAARSARAASPTRASRTLRRWPDSGPR